MSSEKFENLINDAREAYKKGLVNPCQGDFLFSADNLCFACAISAACVLKEGIDASRNKIVYIYDWCEKNYNITHSEMDSFIEGFDGDSCFAYSEACVKAYEYGRDFAKEIFGDK